MRATIACTSLPCEGVRCYKHTCTCAPTQSHVCHTCVHTHTGSPLAGPSLGFSIFPPAGTIRRCSLVLLGVICSALSSMQPHLQSLLLPCEMRVPTRLREYLGSSCHQVSHRKKNCLHSSIRHLFFPLRKRPSLKCKMERRRVQAITSNQEKHQKCL